MIFTCTIVFACVLSEPTIPRYIMRKTLFIFYISLYACVSFVLDVPILKLALGINMNPAYIEEGHDVYFECKIDANPPAYKVIWKHNVSCSRRLHCTFKYIFCCLVVTYYLYLLKKIFNYAI